MSKIHDSENRRNYYNIQLNGIHPNFILSYAGSSSSIGSMIIEGKPTDGLVFSNEKPMVQNDAPALCLTPELSITLNSQSPL